MMNDKTYNIKSSRERHNEISFVINLVHELCNEASISIIAKETKGVNHIAIHDNETGEDYVLVKNGEDK